MILSFWNLDFWLFLTILNLFLPLFFFQMQIHKHFMAWKRLIVIGIMELIYRNNIIIALALQLKKSKCFLLRRSKRIPLINELDWVFKSTQKVKFIYIIFNGQLVHQCLIIFIIVTVAINNSFYRALIHVFYLLILKHLIFFINDVLIVVVVEFWF